MRKVAQDRGAGFVVLIDPDRLTFSELESFCHDCEEAGVDAFFLGSSVLFGASLDKYAAGLKQMTDLPVIGFPGSIGQLSAHLDAVLYLSVISGRNPEYLFGQHVHAAPMIRALELEPISTGYMLVESGRMTTAQYVSGSLPLPSNKPDVAAATALAAEMMGMKLLFTDGGSGAERPVPDEIVAAISQNCVTPLVVGGGIRTPEVAASKVEAGASFVVVGNAIERRLDRNYIAELASAVHVAEPRLLG
ncbi:MAG: geranylgeranylglyceryl/heptaprenylglyceryl phosphate synthase [Bacteroidetes bacterium]|nr:geranylgeranylglyceryl/heptaprenylglyceryl phosphate synthase [Bacteroidota bacterium]